MLFFERPRRPRRALMRWVSRVRSLSAIVASDCRGRVFASRARVQIAPAAIYPLYFSCAADFEYLRLSIRSLTAHGGGHVGRIYVYEDRKQPLTDTQKLALVKETDLPIAYRRTTAPMRWGGVTLLHNELRAFMNLSRELGEHDVIVKVDSDVLFTAGWLFPTVLRGSADLVGQPVASLSTHSRRVVPDVQGGCYFLRVGALPQLRSVPLMAAALQVARTSRYNLWRIPEDRTISQWAHDAALRIRLTDFYLLDLERLRNSSMTTDTEIATCLDQPRAFAVIHFERCKDKMPRCSAWLARRERERERDEVVPDVTGHHLHDARERS
jgi:hypothetical protein